MKQQYKSNWKIAVGMIVFMAFYISVIAWCDSIIATIPRY